MFLSCILWSFLWQLSPVNYLGVGVCGLSSFLHSHMIFLANSSGLFFSFSLTGIFLVLRLGEEPNLS